MGLPLQGIRVLELGQVISGPAVGLFLADLGADVTAVENPRADAFQRERPTLAFLRRNKRNIAIDLRMSDGRELFLDLAKKSDIVVENYGPGTVERLGIDYKTVSTLNKRVIYCSIKGFLPGPYGNRKAADEVVQMMGGLAFMTGLPGRPMRAGASVTDLGAASFGTIAILAALIQRETTGEGQHIQAGLYETVVFWMSQHLALLGVTGEAPEPVTVVGVSDRLGWPIYDVFRTADEKLVFLGLLNDKHWTSFCAELELHSLASDPKLQTNEQRLEQRPSLVGRLREIIGTYRSSDLLSRLERIDVVFAPVHSPADLVSDEHLLASRQLLETEFMGSRFLLPMLPVRTSEFSPSIRCQPRAFAQDTESYLRESGYGEAVISEWLRSGVIRSGSKTSGEAQ
jgi:crotonobetainyl-CoA:carnitine CoA-transferase CaiB-like acyl-CoA transferase